MGGALNTTNTIGVINPPGWVLGSQQLSPAHCARWWVSWTASISLPLWPAPPPPLCDIPSGCCFFTGPWTVTRSSLRTLRWVAAFCRPLRPVILLVSFPSSRSPVVGVRVLCWIWHGVPFVHQQRPVVGVLRLCLQPPHPLPLSRHLSEGDELTQTAQETFNSRSVRRIQGNIGHCSGLRCGAASQNNVLRFMAMTICLCRRGICELSIRCSSPPAPFRERRPCQSSSRCCFRTLWNFVALARGRGGVPQPSGGALSAVRAHCKRSATILACGCTRGAPQAQCARGATIWASGRTRDPYFEILGAPTYLPLIPNQLHCMSKCAHEVLGTILEARLMPVFTYKINCFYVS